MMDRATAAGLRRAGLRSHPTAGLSGAVMSRYRTCRPAHGVSGGVRRRYLGPPFKSAGLILSGLKCYHDPHVISQQDKRLVNIRLICHLLQCGMWIITDFSVCTGLIRALPGKCPLLVPASLRNPQHFHRLCTGLAPLRTSHPHVCAQTAGQQSSDRRAGSSGSARAPALVGLASTPRAGVRDTPVLSPAPAGRAGVRRCRAHVVRRRSQVESQTAPSSVPT